MTIMTAIAAWHPSPSFCCLDQRNLMDGFVFVGCFCFVGFLLLFFSVCLFCCFCIKQFSKCPVGLPAGLGIVQEEQCG